MRKTWVTTKRIGIEKACAYIGHLIFLKFGQIPAEISLQTVSSG